MSIVIMGEPRSKQRARTVTKNGVVMSYTPEETVLAEKEIATLVQGQLHWATPDRTAVFGLESSFFMGNFRRRDVDNMQKLVLDALNGIVWGDDTQVWETRARKDYNDLEHPRTELRLYRLVPDTEG